MKDKIIEILKSHSEVIEGLGDTVFSAVVDDYFDELADEIVKKLNITPVSYRLLDSGEEVKSGDEYWGNEDWDTVVESDLPYIFYSKLNYKHRRKV